MLLKLNFSTSLLKLSLDRLGLFLGDTLFNSLGSAVNESFSAVSYTHLAYITLLMSVANSIHEPLKGMIRAE